MDFNFDKTSKRPVVKKLLIKVLIWIIQITAVIFLAYIIIYYALEKTNVIGDSMNTTLSDGEPIIINKFSYHFTKPKRYDVIVFKQSGREHSYYNIKRVYGLPGETIIIKDGNIYINNELIDNKINSEPMENYGLANEEITLEDNEYFVLGDNRNNSEDSRFASVGNIRSDEIIGKAFLRLSPFNFVNKLNMKKAD